MSVVRQFRSGELVRRRSDGQNGEVVKGGFDPRIRWPNNYISRIDGSDLEAIGWHRHFNYEGECILCGMPA